MDFPYIEPPYFRLFGFGTFGFIFNSFSQAVQTTMKNLGILYRRQGKYQAAETLEDAILRAKKQVSF